MTNIAVIGLNGKLAGKKDEYHKLFKDENLTFVAADGGALIFKKLGIEPDIILGDLDSLTKADIKYFSNEGIEIIKYPVEKNETDGELAVNYCLENNFNKIIFTFAMGGRLDQQFANVFLLEYARDNNIEAIVREPNLEIGLINGKKVFYGKKEWGLSLLPLDKRVEEVTIKGCKYLLDSYSLKRNKTRGISNIICNERAEITHGKGELLYILNKNMYTSC